MSLTRILPLVPLALLAGCAPGGSALTDADRQAVGDEVRAAMAALTDAMNAHDGQAVGAFYAEDPGFLYLGCTDYVTGGATFRQMIGPYYGANSDVTFDQRIVSVLVQSPTAAVVVQRGASSDVEALFWTQVLEKRDGRWVITYEHESWPGCDPPSEPHPFTAPSDSAALLPGGISG